MKIVAFGGALPRCAQTNAEIESQLDLPAGWIESRTGFRVRHVADPSTAVSDLAVAAGREALVAAPAATPPVSLLVLATSWADHPLPPAAPLVAHRLGLAECGAIDVAGACAGYLYALLMAWHTAVASQQSVLVIAANIITRRLAPDDRKTRAVFSDGAGATLLAPGGNGALLASAVMSRGDAYDAVGITCGGSRSPITASNIEAGTQYVRIRDGKRVAREAVDVMTTVGERCLGAAGVAPADVRWWIPHQANWPIIKQTGEAIGIPSDRWITYVGEMGNSSAATIPLNLWRASTEHRFHDGDLVLMTAAGAGFLGAGLLMRL